MSRNRELKEFLPKIREIARNAASEADFAPAFSMLRNFRETVGPIQYDNSAKWYACAAIGALGGLFALAYFMGTWLQERLGDMAGFVIMWVFAVALVVMLVFIGMANSAIDEISDLIFEKDVAFDNGLTAVDIEGRGYDLYCKFREEFGDFRSRGDEDRYIARLVRGEWTGQEFSFPYDYYVFHYVRVYYVTVTKTDANGKTTTTRERRTETLYRHGLILDFPFAKGFVASSGGGDYDYPARFESASEDFNGAFGVGAESALVAAKFLKPAVVLALLELARHFSDLNVEVNRQGRMNIAFYDSDTLDLERKHSIAEPEEFEREIMSRLTLPKLRLLMRFVETAKKHNDSNF